MSKVYIIGAKDTDIQRIREITNISNEDQIIFINDMSEISMVDRHKNTGVEEIIPFINRPVFKPNFFADKKRKSHERSYKFHR